MTSPAQDPPRLQPHGGAERRDERLGRGRRLDPAGYRRVFDRGRSAAGRGLVVWCLQPEGRTEGDARVGVVAGKKSFHDAVDRNRARRRLREVFRLSRHELMSGVELVLVARPRIRQMDFRSLAEDFLKACRKAGAGRRGQ